MNTLEKLDALVQQLKIAGEKIKTTNNLAEHDFFVFKYRQIAQQIKIVVKNAPYTEKLKMREALDNIERDI